MTGNILRLVGAAIIVVFVVFAVSLGRVPQNLLWIYLLIGAISFFTYWRDKRAAQAGKERIRENVLHLSDLVFGIVGGLIGQVLLRHKTAKPEFGAITGMIAALHIVGLAAIITGVVSYPGLS